MKKIKKTAALVLSIALVVGATVNALARSGNNWLYELLRFGGGTTYYVDSVSGNDANSGISENAPWKTLDKVNSVVFSAGDSILFKSGCTFIGQLMPQGSGNAEDGAIVISRYGDGAQPVINANGATENDGAVIRLYNQEYIEINDLELTNSSSVSGIRNGVYVIAEDYGVADHIYVTNCNIHDVLTNARKETLLAALPNGGEGDYMASSGPTAGGIIYVALRGGAMIPTAFNDILIDNNTITRTGTNGGGIGITGEWKAFVGNEDSVIQEGYRDEAPFFGSTNILISNNDMKNTAAAIRFQGVDGRVGNGVIAEHNVSYKPDNCDSNSAMWANHSYNVVWQYNEVYDLDNGGMNDCGAFDADGYSVNTVFQYNYTHNNRGEPVMFCNVGWTDYYDYTNTTGSVFCYNISQNDMWGAGEGHGRLWVQKGAKNNWFYNNVIYVGEGLKGHNIKIAHTWDNYIYNNVFINLSDISTYYIEVPEETVIENNCFYGYHPESEPEGNNNIKLNLDDPMPLADPGKGEVGLDTLQGYMLTEDSVLKGAGKVIENNGGKDFYGNAVSDTAAPDIGVHQTNSFEDTAAPTAATNVKAEAKAYDSIKVTWNAAKDNVGIDRYVVYVDGKPVGRVDGKTTEWTARDLLSNTEYSLLVRTFDAAGYSSDSETVRAKTESASGDELKLNISKAEVYNEAGELCSDFKTGELVAPRFTVVNGEGEPVANALVEVLVAADSQSDYETVTDMTDENGIAQTGFYTDTYRGEATAVDVRVKNVTKEGYIYSGESGIKFNVTGTDDACFANLVQNSDFETALKNTWSVSDDVKITEGVSYNGSSALEFSASESFTANASQSFTGLPNGIYTLTYYVKNTAVSASVTLSGYGSSVTETIPVSPEWQQISVSDINVTTGKISLRFDVTGDAAAFTYIDDVELSQNLATNTLYKNVHPYSKLPSDYYYTTENGWIGEDGSNVEKMVDDTSIKAVNIAAHYTASYNNALKICSDEAFKVTLGQTLRNVANGTYTLKIAAINKGGIKAYIAVKDYGGEETVQEIRMSSGFSTTKISGINVTSGTAVIELRFEGEGKMDEYIILSGLSFSVRSDYPDKAAVTPANYNILTSNNPSFENDGKVTSSVPSAWANTWSSGEISCYATDEEAYTGDYSCKIILHHDKAAESDRNGSKSTALTLKPKVQAFTNLSPGYYTLSLWVKGDYRVKLTATANGNVPYERYSQISDQWHKVEIKNMLVTNGQLGFSVYSSKTEEHEFVEYTAYIDDIALTRSTASYDISEQIESLPDVQSGETNVTLPEFEGFGVSVAGSSNEEIITSDGTVITPKYDETVKLILCVTNLSYSEDVSYTEAEVKVCGMLDENAQLSYILGDANFDEVFDIRDIVRFKKYISVFDNEINFAAVDDDQNGILSGVDLAALRKILLSGEGYGAFAQGEAMWNSNWDILLSQ